MTDAALSPNQQLKQRIKKIQKIFERDIDDPLIKEYIFNDKDFDRCAKKSSDYIVYIGNILSLAFVFAHGCYLCDQADLESVALEAKKNSSQRILNSLQRAYTQYPVTDELMQFVLTDIQLDMLQGDESELSKIFYNLCSFRNPDFSFTTYYKLLAKYRLGPSRFNMSSAELATLFCDLLENLSFLSDYRLERDEDGQFCFLEKNFLDYGEESKNSVIPVRHLLYQDESKYLGIFPLFSAEKSGKGKGKRLQLRYVSPNGYNTLLFTVSRDPALSGEGVIVADPEEYYAELTGLDWSDNEDAQKKNSNFIEQVHAINYKYIKNLALAISDAIGANLDAKEALYRAFHNRHRDIFDKVHSVSEVADAALDWDGIVVMLLIESSPTSVLEVLFRASRQSFYSIAGNLCRRIDNPDMPIYRLTTTQLNALVSEIIRKKLIFGEAEGFGRVNRPGADHRMFPRAAASVIVSSLSAFLEDAAEEKPICAGNIYDNISILAKARTEATPEQQQSYVSIILSETLRHVLCFYQGILAYGEVKQRFDAESCNTYFSEVRIAQYQKKLQSVFMEAAQREAEALRELKADAAGIRALLERFLALCEACSGAQGTAAPLGHRLYSALGKHEILNVAELKGRVSSYLASLGEMTADNMEGWITLAQDVLNYFCFGSFEGEPEEKNYFHTVYPLVATYNRGNENYDGHKTVTFTLNLDMENGAAEAKEYISVLTEFDYHLNDVFYCLPNVLRSNKKWWIDPLLISYKEFNDIFVEQEP